MTDISITVEYRLRDVDLAEMRPGETLESYVRETLCWLGGLRALAVSIPEGSADAQVLEVKPWQEVVA